MMNIRRFLKNKRIAVLYGGTSAEREISLLSGNAVVRALTGAGFDAVAVDVGPAVAFDLRKKKIDLAYLALHGPGGEDGTIQGLLETMGIPYTGCGVLASALSMDKICTKEILAFAGLPTPRWQAAERGGRAVRVSRFPVVVKPVTQGSAIGVSVVSRRAELSPALRRAFRLDERIIIEDYVQGTEITVGVLGGKPLPVIEIVPESVFYDFESKYKPGKSKHLIPPRLPPAVVRKAQALAGAAFAALGCRAVARVDMIVDKRGVPWILEVNTIPGMTETSLLPDAARAAGMNFTELVLKIIEYSVAR